MTTSDIERTLAEARAAAARRLEALRDAQAQPAQVAQAQPVAVEHVIVPRREPAASAGQPAPEIAVASPVHGMHSGQPDAAAPSVTPYEAQSAPMVANAVPTPEYRDEANRDDLQYAAYEPVAAPHASGDTTAYVPVDPLPRARPEAYAAAGDHEDAQFDEPLRKPGFMAGAVAGFAAFRRSRAERRALAHETALQSGDAATPHLNQQRLTAKEQRWERRRKRHLFEEILGWILVPIILVAIYFFALWILDLFGTTPDALIEGMQTIWSRFR
jgi:hypothetical protein